MKKWEISRVREEHADEVRALARSLEIGELTAALLYGRGYTVPGDARAFLDKGSDAFYDPFLMKDMDAAVRAVRAAVTDGKKIVIYGDYDVDGVTSVVCLYLYLRSMGADVDYYIPSRSEEGYGVSISAIDRLCSGGAELIITVDTGITAAAEIEYAASLGIDFVVTDHHACHAQLPRALAVINPHRSDCGYPFEELAGVGVVFKLICAIEKEMRAALGQTDTEYLSAICSQYADLVAIGTVADVMPLTGENRLLVALGLSMIERTQRTGLIALIDEACGQGKRRRINASFIGFTIAPRINAAGRLGHASRAAELFLCEDEQTAIEIARELCDTNKERQREENQILNEAIEMIARYGDLSHDEVIVLSSDGWHPGVIGIVASRLTERYGKPTILISLDENVGKGSGRSVKGVNLVDALATCSDLLIKFGGHELAAGLSVARENIDPLRDRLNAYVRDHRDLSCEDVLSIDCEITPDELTVETAAQIELLEPYGTANPEPILALRGARIVEVRPIGGGKHTRFVLERDGICCDAVYFGCNLMQTNFYAQDTVDVAFHLQINEYMNIQSAQLLVCDLRLSGQSLEAMERGRTQYEGAKDGHRIAQEENLIPEREDFAAVYRYIRGEVRKSNDIIGAKGIARRLPGVNYAKARYIIDIFREVNLIGIENFGTEPDIYRFRLKPETGKVNLEKSSIYKKLKSRKEYKQS